MNIPIFPVQKRGVLAVWAAIAALALALVWQFSIPGQPLLDPARALESLPLGLVYLGAMAGAGVSFVSGLLAVLRDREYALLVFAAVVLSAFGLFFGITGLVNWIFQP